MSNRRECVILPKDRDLLTIMGENIKLARKRRKLTTIKAAERAGIARSTLYLIEMGDPGVSLGNYFKALKVLGLAYDLLNIAKSDPLGHKLIDIELLGRDENEYGGEESIKFSKRELLKKGALTIFSRTVMGLHRGYFSEDIKTIVGLDAYDLLDYLNSNPYGFRFGGQFIHIDHIVPLSTILKEVDVNRLSHFTNLQLLPSEYNQKKGDRPWNKEDFHKWMNIFHG